MSKRTPVRARQRGSTAATTAATHGATFIRARTSSTPHAALIAGGVAGRETQSL